MFSPTTAGAVVAFFHGAFGYAFEPEVTEAMGIAFENACYQLGVRELDPDAELVAAQILHIAGSGECRPHQLCTEVLNELGLVPPVAVSPTPAETVR